MNFEEFQSLAMRTAKPLPFRENMRHVAYGVTGEAGEFADCIKKYDIYEQELDAVNAIEELGDLLYYIAVGANALEISMQDIARGVINKLRKRYPDTYSNELAKARIDKRSIDDASQDEWDEAARIAMVKAKGAE